MQLFLLLFFTLSLYASEGEEIYKNACVSCHAIDGKSSNNLAFLVKPRKLSLTILRNQQSFAITKEGAHFWGAHSDIMPSFKYLLTDKQIHSVTDYISKTFNPNIEKKIAKLMQSSQQLTLLQRENRLQLGEKIFKKTCALCHGIKGDAKSEYVSASKENKTFIYPYNLTRTLLDEEQIFLYAKYGGLYWGTQKDNMQSWSSRYNDVALKSVAYYIQQKIKKLD